MDRISFHTYKYSIYRLSKNNDRVHLHQIIRYTEEVAKCTYHEDDIRNMLGILNEEYLVMLKKYDTNPEAILKHYKK